MFTQPGTWNGGHYALDFRLPNNQENTIQESLNAIWNHPALEGCFLRSDLEPIEQPKELPLVKNTQGHLYGIADLPNGKRVACGCFLSDYGRDGCWFSLYLPLGTLDNAYPVGNYPFIDEQEESPESWMKEINPWLKGIAETVYQKVKFRIGVVGFEVDYFDLEKRFEEGIPAERWEGILIPKDEQLVWYPPTIYKPQYEFQ